MLEYDLVRDGARADLSRLLSACYYEPSPVFREEGLFGSIVAAAAAVDADLESSARRLERAFEADDLQDLLVDYTRLFLGPTGAPAKPYGSVWLEKNDTLMRESTLDAIEHYRQAGFAIAEDFRDLPDHVAVELEFLYVLIFRELLARRDGDPAAAEAAAALRSRFVQSHLGQWIRGFAMACTENAQTDFYRALGATTARFVELERSRAE